MKSHREHWEELPEINPELDEDITDENYKSIADGQAQGIPADNQTITEENLHTLPEGQRSAIKEKVRERKFVFQFIDHENGKRSEPFIGNYDLLREILQEAAERGERPDQEDYVLLVAVIGESDEDTLIPGTPLVKCKTLLELDDIEKGV